LSVWLREGRETLRLDLMKRYGRPPVVSPHAPALRALVREASGLLDQSRSEPRENGRERVAKIDRLLAAASLDGALLTRAGEARAVRLVIPDATRRGPWQEWVYSTARWLEEHTPHATSRVALIATGVHRPAIPEGLRLPAGWSVIPNGLDGYASHRAVGRTPRGTPVRLHPAWVDGDLRVALADVSFHYFAGFGGGRKLVFPGLGETEGILANHRLTLDEEGRLRAECAPGRLLGNIVHEDLITAVSYCPPDLLLTAFEPEPGGASALLLGDWREAHEAACARFLRGHLLPHTQRPEILIADAGGHPRDATFLQAHKSLQHAARFVVDRGRLLIVAGLEEGCGSPTLEKLMRLDAADLTRRALSNYELHTHTALALRMVLDRIEVGILNHAGPELLSGTGIRSFALVDEALAWLEGGAASRTWGWLTRAEEVLPEFGGGVATAREPHTPPAHESGERGG
jgi:lactate racemase